MGCHRYRESCCLARPSQRWDKARNGGSCWPLREECARGRVGGPPPTSACAFYRARALFRVLRTTWVFSELKRAVSRRLAPCRSLPCRQCAANSVRLFGRAEAQLSGPRLPSFFFAG